MNKVAAIVGIIIAIVVFSAFMPIMTSGAHVTEIATATNDGAEYRLDTEIGDGLVIEVSDGVIVNGTQIALDAANPGIIVRSDKFIAIWYKSNTSTTVSDAELGSVANVKKITIGADGSYTYTNTSDVDVPATTPITEIFYPSNTGKYGSFVNTPINVDIDGKWYGQFPNIAMSPWYLAVIEYEGGKDSIQVTESKLIVSGTVVDADTTITYTDAPVVSTDGKSFIVSNLTVSRSTEYDGNTYALTATPQIIAPLEYHYEQTVQVMEDLLGIIPLLIAIGLVLVSITVIIGRNE